ncbi:hypothetical protein [Agaribacter flavus]|uniref:Uncharacterized protein n=1 Tax=Agaribacter flavus TaxID=1902781 RepID=A0ABV7FMK2_9ALTE
MILQLDPSVALQGAKALHNNTGNNENFANLFNAQSDTDNPILAEKFSSIPMSGEWMEIGEHMKASLTAVKRLELTNNLLNEIEDGIGELFGNEHFTARFLSERLESSQQVDKDHVVFSSIDEFFDGNLSTAANGVTEITNLPQAQNQASFTRQLRFSTIGNGVLAYSAPTHYFNSEVNTLGSRLEQNNPLSRTLTKSGNSGLEREFNARQSLPSNIVSENSFRLYTDATKANRQLLVSQAKQVDGYSFALVSQLAELTKRSLLITDNSVQRTLWIRDYSLDASPNTSASLANFVKSKEILVNRVFLNGKILWEEKGDLK